MEPAQKFCADVPLTSLLAAFDGAGGSESFFHLSRVSESYDDLAFWCLLAGLILAPSALLFWKPRGIIFLDRVCINQFDNRHSFAPIPTYSQA